LADNSVDSVVTDPPYGLSDHDAGDIAEALACWLRGDVYTHDKRGFMGKAWDGFVPGPDVWREVYRVLKPGGHLVCFSGSRTHDLMGIAIRLAGFELRDTINHASTPHYLGWVQGQGFPKSLDVSKAIDKAAGAEREKSGPNSGRTGGIMGDAIGRVFNTELTAPATPDAQRWQGWHTALKPSLEPVLLFRKPLAASTVAAQVLATGTGALNVDATRVGTGEAPQTRPNGKTAEAAIFSASHGSTMHKRAEDWQSSPAGRWPSNLVLSHSEGCVKVGRKRVETGTAVRHNSGGNTFGGDNPKPPMGDMTYADADGMEEVDEWRCAPGCAVAALDSQAGERKSGAYKGPTARARNNGVGLGTTERRGGTSNAPDNYGDTDSASRFFPVFAYEQDDFVPWLYCAKASRREREAGLTEGPNRGAANGVSVRNAHPT
jgi:hypothetical protein